MEANFLQIISALTALVAVIVGPIVTLYVARRQNAASVLAKNRQEWINTLRKELTEVIVVIRNLETIMRLPAKHRDAKRLWELGEEGKFKEARIRLLINPKERDHTELVELIQKALHLALKIKDENREQLQIAENEIINKAQTVLKREWERVKALK